MCILEMVTFDYPYSECTHPAQIYKKVISGKKPEALYKVKDPEVRRFVEKCLVTVSLRLSARELLSDPFLQIDDYGSAFKSIEYQIDYDVVGPLQRQPFFKDHQSNSSLINGYSNNHDFESENDLDCHPLEFGSSEIDLFSCQEDEHLTNVNISIRGRRREDDGIFLRLRIADKEGRIRNIYFPFDIETDTALCVATEMVAELELTDQDVTKIADMIDSEIAILVPDWKKGLLHVEEGPHLTSSKLCQNCASNGSLSDYISSNNLGAKDLQVLQCSRQGCAAVHGRFEEITYQVEGSDQQCIRERVPVVSSQSNGCIHYADIWAQRDGPELSSDGSGEINFDEEHEMTDQSSSENDKKIINMDSQGGHSARNSFSANLSTPETILDDYENEIRQELRWLKAKYQMQLREIKNQQLGVLSKSSSLSPVLSKSSSLSPNSDKTEQRKCNGSPVSSVASPLKEENSDPLKSFASWKPFGSYLSTDTENKCTNLVNQKIQSCEAINGSYSPEQMITANSFYTGALLPHSLHRATSLPVDAVDY